ncbi:hypothetical protein C8Q80DRAFT_1274218 [Daedaleopsis nitida]|nr:hypothetical protein C8Q80DRAFT_1274218 [Daedaleopsis nitida]
MQYTFAAADNVAKIPDNISFDQAASVPVGTIISGKPLKYVYVAIIDPAVQELGYDILAPGGSLVLTNPWDTATLQPRLERDSAAGLTSRKIARVFGSLAIPSNKQIIAKQLQDLSPTITTSSLNHASQIQVDPKSFSFDMSL